MPITNRSRTTYLVHWFIATGAGAAGPLARAIANGWLTDQHPYVHRQVVSHEAAGFTVAIIQTVADDAVRAIDNSRAHVTGALTRSGLEMPESVTIVVGRYAEATHV